MNTVSSPIARAIAHFGYAGASITLSADGVDELLADLAKFGVTPSNAEKASADKAVAGVESKPAPSPKPKAEKPAAPAATVEAAPSPAPSLAAVAKPPAVDYPTLQKSVFELAGLVQKKGLEASEHVLSIAVALGAPNFKGLDPAKWSEALDAVKAKIVAVNAMEEALA